MRVRFSNRYLLLGLLLTAVYPLLPGGFLKEDLAFDSVGASAIVASGWAIWRMRSSSRRAWLLLGLGQSCFVTGDIVSSLYDHFLGEAPFPSVADGAYLAGYPLMAVGLLVVVRARAPGYDWSSLLDGLIVAVGFGMFSWAFLMAPGVARPHAFACGGGGFARLPPC